jgi:hypothetical protein|tara:strand:- start:5679 stop:6221 length:543 start_codon:yes stop_codon:yes gene_type:complete
MKTRRRTKTQNKVLTRKNSLSPQIINLISIYWDLVIEYQTKQTRFKNSFKQCLKWKKTLPTFFGLYPRAFPILDKDNVSRLNNPIVVINKSIQDLRKDLLVIHNEFLHVNAICEVEYRTKYNILHTLPKKKLQYIQKIYPDIKRRIAISRAKIKNKRYVNSYKKPKKVRFGKKQTRQLYS